MDQITHFMKAFVLGEEVDFNDFPDVDYIGQRDLVSMRWHHDAAKEIRQKADAEPNLLERQRLLNIAASHVAKLDSLLEKYGEGVDHVDTPEAYEKTAARLIATLSLMY